MLVYGEKSLVKAEKNHGNVPKFYLRTMNSCPYFTYFISEIYVNQESLINKELRGSYLVLLKCVLWLGRIENTAVGKLWLMSTSKAACFLLDK